MTAANISFNTGRSPKAFGMIFVRRRSSRKSRSRRFVRDVSTAAGDRQGFPKHQISAGLRDWERKRRRGRDRKSTRLNSSHITISYAVFCLKKKKDTERKC